MKPRRTSRPLNDMPGLFDSLDFRPDAGLPADDAADLRRREILAEARRNSISTVQIADHSAEKLRFVSFGSGSSGNCAFVGTLRCGVLVDAGVDADKVQAGLKANGIDPARVAGIIITHDHGDHVRYVYKLLRRHADKRLWATPKTLSGILRRHSISRRIKEYHQPIYKEFEFHAGPLAVTPFETSHDGTDNVGFSISCGAETFVVATDMGCATERALHYMAKATVLMVESNYDARMLAAGRYPMYLQARIRGERGHMDNTATAARLAELWTPAMHHVFLCHLSHDNNTPELAMDAARAALEQAGATVAVGAGEPFAMRKAGVQLAVLPRFDSSPLYVFS